ncbi:MAG: hypothetical protein DHS20C02_08800 [Micavibrio sp.]|nr:MAG: hypothetical protein DHS20C02_08800 [Micavibrio sp.]
MARIFGRWKGKGGGQGPKSDPKRYEREKELAETGDTKKRLTLAKNSKTHKEILYYLAEKDPDPMIRKAVAENKEMPLQASPVLAGDADEDVRMALARRLVDLLPGLTGEEHSQLYAFAVQSLGTLALDEVLKIRVALSSTLKDHAHTPPKIAGQLARDVEREVSEPILRFCAALSDDDLLDILKDHPASWAVQAVAGRDDVSEGVSVAVIKTKDVPGGSVLIGNEGAQMTESLLHMIVEMAKEFPEWQKPMATRSKLPVSVVKELAEFVDASVRDLLLQRSDFDEQMSEEIAAIFRRRVDYATEEDGDGEGVEERLNKIVEEGRLNEETISDALAMRDKAFVNAAIARILGIDVAGVVKVFEMKAPKPIVAMAWKAGLSMRMALQLQKEIGHIQPKDLLYPKDGTDYPLSEDDLNWQLEFLGLKK